jgi:two-component system chemotaxis response regulator CheB
LDVAGCIETLLIPKIKLLGRRERRAADTVNQVPVVASPTLRSPAMPARASPARVAVVVIGASTGGPNALAELFPTFPPDWSVPLLVVQHMPPGFTARLAERLAEKSRLGVREAVAGEPVAAAQAWVAPGDYHLLVRREGQAVRLALSQEPPVNSCRPAVDVLFRSAAEVYGPGVLAIVLTGMGQDGLQGCERVRAAGGQVLVQDEASSVVWSMPGAVARAGLADGVLPLEQLGAEILRRVQQNPAGKTGKVE